MRLKTRLRSIRGLFTGWRGPSGTRYVNRLARRAGIIVIFAVTALLGTVTGVLFAYAADLPQISALDDYAPSTITRIYGSGGEVIGEFATERRVVIGYDDISPWLRQAIIAAEDARFNSHFGLSIPHIILAGARDILEQRSFSSWAGGSTITQQLARKLSLGGSEPLGMEKTLERKVREIMLAIQIEKRYTKREILTLYCNQLYFGSGAYGVEAAARLYFQKPARELNLEEAALIAGIIQSPSRQSPFVDPARARSRRSYALQRMAEEGYITQAEADAAKATPLGVTGRPRRNRSTAPFFVEEVRKYLEAQYGAKQLYEGGLSVHTSMDVRLQAAAHEAVVEGLRRVDKRQGFRTAARNVIAEGHTVDSFEHDRWRFPVTEGEIVPAVVTGVANGNAQIRIGRYGAEIRKDGFAWTQRASAAELVKPGDLIEVRVVSLDEATATATAALDQEPLVEGALLAIENRTGKILAMVGGYNFERSQFNRATQASRQLGSLFKGVLYTAAIDRGYTPTSIIMDEPVTLPGGPEEPDYEPTNYDNQYEGPVTLRHALEKSRNVPAVRMMDRLGPEQVIAYARRFGFTSPLPPFLSVALGSAEATLLEITSTYSVFPNRGIRMTPYQILKISDRDGNVLEENRPESHDAIRADTAYVMISMLRGVIRRGTGVRAASLSWPLGGKTGTVDQYTDAWFIGFDPDITVGVWVGHDQKKTLGDKEEGAAVALPIWIEFMRAYISDRAAPEGFVTPGNIVFLAVDQHTGQVTEPWAPNAIQEAFISGTQPGTVF